MPLRSLLPGRKSAPHVGARCLRRAQLKQKLPRAFLQAEDSQQRTGVGKGSHDGQPQFALSAVGQGKLEEWPFALPIIDDIQRAGELAVRMRRRSHYPEGLGIPTGEESQRMLITLNSAIEQQSSWPFAAP